MDIISLLSSLKTFGLGIFITANLEMISYVDTISIIKEIQVDILPVPMEN